MNANEEAAVREGHPATVLVLDEVRREREAQDAQWGLQRHPSFPPLSPEERANEFGVLTEEQAKELLEKAYKANQGTWGHVLTVGFANVVGAPDEPTLRHRLVQQAALCTAWVEDIDRRRT